MRKAENAKSRKNRKPESLYSVFIKTEGKIKSQGSWENRYDFQQVSDSRDT